MAGDKFNYNTGGCLYGTEVAEKLLLHCNDNIAWSSLQYHLFLLAITPVFTFPGRIQVYVWTLIPVEKRFN